MIGSVLGPYKVVAKLGEGGMGEVYRATDARLGRAVALKTLPPEFALDPDRRARFEREAKTLATLNHPHIAQLYGLEEVPGTDGAPPTLALAMELVEGEDLAQRIAGGPVPLDEAVPLARQIAEGLEAAHEAGIVHRDLKPANIRVTAEGVVKILDFGLAKPVESAAHAPLTHSPTLTSPALTTRGVVLGTASYMAPEQAKGKPVDRRADIWAFGCVLYELLTGRRAFEGEDVTEILGAIVKTEPEWTKLPAATPRHVRTLLARCLAKDKTQRLQHIGDARLELTNPPVEETTSGVVLPPARSRSGRLGWVAAAVMGLAAAALVATRPATPPPTSGPPVRAIVDLPVDDQSERPELAPDGRRFAYVGSSEARVRGVWVYDLASGARSMVRGTEGGRAPFWSPDGQQLAFFADDKLKVVPSEGGTARVVCDVQTTARVGGAWHANGTILYSEDSGRPIYRVAAGGGAPQAATTFVATVPGAFGANTSANYRPNFLPSGTEFMYWRLAEPWGTYLATTDQSETRLIAGLSEARFVEPRWLLSITDDQTLVARSFDPATRLLGDQVVPVADDVHVQTQAGWIGASATPAVLAWRSDVWPSNRLAVVDRAGRVVRYLSEPSLYEDVQVSDDGHTAAVESGGNRRGRRTVLLFDVDAAAPPRNLSSGAMDEGNAQLSPDGRRLLFNTRPRGWPDANRLWIRDLRSAGVGQEMQAPGIVDDWTADGRWLVSTQLDGNGARFLWATPTEGGQPVRLGDNMSQGQVSPNGRWLAFASNNATGSVTQVFVQSFPKAGVRQLLWQGSATQVRWSRDGRELFFRTADDALMAVPVLEADGDLSLGPATVLFRLPIAGPNGAGIGAAAQYDVLPDGMFVVNLEVSPQKTTFHVMTNWQQLLK